MRRWRAPLGWVAGVLALLLLVGSGMAVWTVRRSFPQTEGTLTLDVLDDPVEVYRDEWGIPHLYGASMADLARAQGFVHAQDRFWEMDVRRHTTAGRLSELFGAEQVDTDAFIRTLGWRRVAEQEFALVSEATRRWLDAYAAGVNAYLDQHDHTSDLSLEYAVLGLRNPGYEPEPWQPADSLAWLKALAWDLRSNMRAEIERGLLTAAIPPDRVSDLYPTYPYERHGTIVDGGEVADGAWRPHNVADAASAALAEPAASRPAPGLTAARPHLAALRSALDALPPMVGKAGPGIGSNSWVIGGQHTATGMPLLANDPHLGPALPSIWYAMGLHCIEQADDCALDVTGYTFSGVPGVIIGANDRVAWGFTNLGPDVTDLYLERLDGDRYLVDGEWRPLDVRTETIRVAGGEDTEVTVRSTRHGPLLSDVSGQLRDLLDGTDLPTVGTDLGTDDLGTDDHGVALQWTALEPSRTADGILALNTARTFDDFREGAELFGVPAQNLVYADVDGHIGYQAPGRIPIRAEGHSGLYPVPGWTTATDWRGYIPFEELPWELDPADGVIVTANQAVVGPDYTHYLTEDWAYGYRADRIRDQLDQVDRATLDDLLQLQLDTRNGNADTLVPALLELPEDSPAVATAQSVLQNWDRHQDADSSGGALFEAVWRHLLRRTFHDELPADARPGGGSRWFEVVRQLVDEPDSAWWDNQDTAQVETRDEVLTAAVRDAVDELSERLGDDPAEWRWGALHTLALTHQTLGTSGIGPIERLFNRGPLETSGGKSIVNATGWTAPEGYEVDWVPSMRMVVDLGDLDRSRWIHLTGQSGHAYHEHYVDMAPLWRDGATTPMLLRRPSVEEAARHRLLLAPGDGG